MYGFLVPTCANGVLVSTDAPETNTMYESGKTLKTTEPKLYLTLLLVVTQTLAIFCLLYKNQPCFSTSPCGPFRSGQMTIIHNP